MSCFNNLCRLCAGKVDGLVSLNIFALDQEDLYKKISTCLPIKITPSDGFSKLVCVECAFKLDVVYEFRERCLVTAQLFEQMGEQELVESYSQSQPSHDLHYEEIELILPNESQEEVADVGMCKEELLVAGKIEEELATTTPADADCGSIDDKEKDATGEQKQFFCTECKKRCPSNFRLSQHMKRHADQKQLSCSFPDCLKTFKSKIGLDQHKAGHTGIFEYFCPVCFKGFQCKSYLKVHQRVHSDDKPHRCPHCSQSFKTKQNLSDHINRHLGVKPFLCDICGRGFITKGLCNSHQKTHTGGNNKQYPCPICRKKFVSKHYLMGTHLNTHTGQKNFICEVCGKGCLTRVDLKIHLTVHTGEKSYVCDNPTCGKRFARRDALRSHIRSHTGERPYKCSFCGQSFSQYSPMAIHRRLHTNERPYRCNQCNKAFISKSALSSHLKKSHQPG